MVVLVGAARFAAADTMPEMPHARVHLYRDLPHQRLTGIRLDVETPGREVARYGVVIRRDHLPPIALELDGHDPASCGLADELGPSDDHVEVWAIDHHDRPSPHARMRGEPERDGTCRERPLVTGEGTALLWVFGLFVALVFAVAITAVALGRRAVSAARVRDPEAHPLPRLAAERVLASARTRDTLWLIAVTGSIAWLATLAGPFALMFGLWWLVRVRDLVRVLRARRWIADERATARVSGSTLIVSVEQKHATALVSRRAVRRARATAIPSARARP